MKVLFVQKQAYIFNLEGEGTSVLNLIQFILLAKFNS